MPEKTHRINIIDPNNIDPKPTDPWEDPENYIENFTDVLSVLPFSFKSLFELITDDEGDTMDVRTVGLLLFKNLRNSLCEVGDSIEREIGPIQLLFRRESTVPVEGIDPEDILGVRIKPGPPERTAQEVDHA